MTESRTTSINTFLPKPNDRLCVNVKGTAKAGAFQVHIIRSSDDNGYIIDIYDKNGNEHIESVTIWDEDFADNEEI